eukprot:COSAG02_NODE_46_length_45443_cov_36.731497_9_plen_148_part_00
MANPVVFMDITIGGAAAGRLTFEVSGGGCSPAALEPVRRGAAEAPACDGSPWLSVPSSGYWSVPVSVSASIVMQRSVSACLPACLSLSVSISVFCSLASFVRLSRHGAPVDTTRTRPPSFLMSLATCAAICRRRAEDGRELPRAVHR